MSDSLLKLDKVTIRFGGLTAVSELDLKIGGRELVGLIGPNGAGKTTVFNLDHGSLSADRGRDFFSRTTDPRISNRISSPSSASPGLFKTSGCSPA